MKPEPNVSDSSERRRELNRIAAQKLRNRQKERATSIRQEYFIAQSANTRLQYEKKQLVKEREMLEENLQRHLKSCRKNPLLKNQVIYVTSSSVPAGIQHVLFPQNIVMNNLQRSASLPWMGPLSLPSAAGASDSDSRTETGSDEDKREETGNEPYDDGVENGEPVENRNSRNITDSSADGRDEEEEEEEDLAGSETDEDDDVKTRNNVLTVKHENDTDNRSTQQQQQQLHPFIPIMVLESSDI